MIESWIDELAKIWEISDRKFGTVRSIKLIERAEFPDSIDPAMLDTSPLALTVPGGMKPEYSFGGPILGYWNGVTEFHVAPDLNRSRIPSLLQWYGMIVRAAAANMKLNNTVDLFLIDDREDAITGPVALKYGNEAEHWGFIVHWKVQERLEADVTVSA